MIKTNCVSVAAISLNSLLIPFQSCSIAKCDGLISLLTCQWESVPVSKNSIHKSTCSANQFYLLFSYGQNDSPISPVRKCENIQKKFIPKQTRAKLRWLLCHLDTGSNVIANSHSSKLRPERTHKFFLHNCIHDIAEVHIEFDFFSPKKVVQ